MMTDLVAKFHEAMLDTYRIAKSECGYNAQYFLNMVNQQGGLEAAQKLLRSTTISSGLYKLSEYGRLDICMEAQVLRPEFAPLFSEEELNMARSKLEKFGYMPEWAQDRAVIEAGIRRSDAVYTSGYDLVDVGEIVLAIFTKGPHFQICADGTGSTGHWSIDPEHTFDRLLIYHRFDAEQADLYSAASTTTIGPNEEGRYTIQFREIQHVGVTATSWTTFVDSGANPVRYLIGQERDAEERKYWALCANPTIYDIDRAVQILEVDRWNTGKSEIRAGDRVAIWRTAGRDGLRGVIALGEVLDDPQLLDDVDNPFWRDAQGGQELVRRAPVRYYLPPHCPIFVGDDGDEAITDLSVYRARGGTVFSIRPEQWAVLAKAMEQRTDTGFGEENREEDDHSGHASSGQGYGLNADQRRAVELRAMGLAVAHYQEEWAKVTDVSAKASCDLVCRNPDGSSLYVEVKGTTGGGESVMLTANEVDLARKESPNTALFVVSGIRLQESEDGAGLIGVDGKTREVRPWQPDDHDLTPTAYRCALAAKKR